MKPTTRYARSGDVHIAYQVVGEGPLDLVYVPGWVSHVENVWDEPLLAALLNRLASFSRLHLIDRRGTGLSDPVADLPTIEERMDDVRAVLDHAGTERAALVGVSEGGPMCACFAATYPERTRALVLVTSYPVLKRGPDVPWGISEEAMERFFAMIGERWGTGVSAEVFAPSLANDAAFLERWGRMERFSVAPGAARRLLRIAAETDVRGVLDSIRVPTLVLHREGDRATPLPGAEYLAEHIEGAELVVLPGSDHFPFVGNADALLDEIERFLTGRRPAAVADRVLATVLFSDIVDSTGHVSRLGDRAWRDLLERFRTLVRAELARHRGQEVDTAGDGFLASFDGPARAVHCAQAIRAAARPLGLRLRQGLHTGECELIGGKVGGLAVHLGARVAALAEPDAIWVSSTVRDLVAGSRLGFEDRGAHALKGVPDAWRLFAVAPEARGENVTPGVARVALDAARTPSRA